MQIGSVLRIAGFLVLILSASIVVTLLPDIFRIPKFPFDKSYSATKSAYPSTAQPEKDPRLGAIEEAARRTSLEGEKVIEKALLVRPEFERRVATKTVEKMIVDAQRAEGLNSIEPLGWEALQKRDGRWRLTFHYHRWPSLYLLTEWEYDHTSNRLYLLNSQHGPEFWVRVANLQ